MRRYEMNKGNAKRSLRRAVIIIGSIALLLFLSSLTLMILANYVFNCSKIDIFSTAISGSYDMNIPFSIIIDIFSSTGGILLGLKIDRYSSEKNEEENIEKMWTSIKKMVSRFASDIETQTLFVLSNYKIHWDALLRSDSLSVHTLQNDEKYFDLSDLFYYLDFHRNFWKESADKTYFEIVNDFTINKSFRAGLEQWKEKVDRMNKSLG